jgi:hypothetical protein
MSHGMRIVLTRVDVQTELFSCLEHIRDTFLPRIGVAKVKGPLQTH